MQRIFWLVLSVFVVWATACGSENQDDGAVVVIDPDGEAFDCVAGQTACGVGGLYACNAELKMERTAECECEVGKTGARCTDAMGPCAGSSGEICHGDSIRNCATGAVTSCNGGRCLMSEEGPACATKEGDLQCERTTVDGAPVRLLCTSGDEIAKDQICDWRTGRCEPSQFLCERVVGVDEGKITCDTSGDFHTKCSHGQPSGLVCEGDSKCRPGDTTSTCYAPSKPGETCGDKVVCSPEMDCVQTPEHGATCQPGGFYECNQSDFILNCVDKNTAVACAHGTMWKWEELDEVGSVCVNDKLTVPRGSTCIPGLADCEAGLVCDKTPYDIAGVCAPPKAGAPAECVLTHQVSTGNSCQYKWDTCRNGKQYTMSCQARNIKGVLVTICGCFVGETKQREFGGDPNSVCGLDTVTELDALINSECGWALTTTDIAGE